MRDTQCDFAQVAFSSHLLEASHVERAVLSNAILGQIALDQGFPWRPRATSREVLRAAEHCHKPAKEYFILTCALLAEVMSLQQRLLLGYIARHTNSYACIGGW